MFDGISALGRKRARRPGNTEVCNFRRGALGRLGAKVAPECALEKWFYVVWGKRAPGRVRSGKGAREAGG